MKFQQEHSLSKDEAKKRLQALTSYWAKYGVDVKWEGDSARFSGKVKGVQVDASMTVKDRLIDGEGSDFTEANLDLAVRWTDGPGDLEGAPLGKAERVIVGEGEWIAWPGDPNPCGEDSEEKPPIVVGDARNVLTRTRPLGFDPFKGYRRKERNVRDLRVREAIKEIAQLDGAFVVARDGTVEAACRLIDAPMTGLTLPKGLGTRHWAAAAITEATNALAVVVSQSNGTVRLFQSGEVILRIAPMRHARAMKWQDSES